MSTNIQPGQGGLDQQNQKIKSYYGLPDGTNAQRTNVFGSGDLTTVWASTQSASLTLNHPSEYLMFSQTTSNQNAAVNFNSNDPASAVGGTSFNIPGNLVVFPVRGVTNINYIGTSASVRLSIANFY